MDSFDYEDLKSELTFIIEIKQRIGGAFDSSPKEQDMLAHVQMILDEWMKMLIEKSN